MFRNAALVAALLLACGAAGHAAQYDITFLTPSVGYGGSFTADGSFNYDAQSGFSDFTVTANDLVFDITAAANSATDMAVDGCPSTLSGAPYTFQLLTSCNIIPFTGNNSTPDVGYYFSIMQDPYGARAFFAFGGPSHYYGSGFVFAIGDLMDVAPAGSDTTQEGGFAVSAVPEPGSLALLATALLGIVGFRRWRRPG